MRDKIDRDLSSREKGEKNVTIVATCFQLDCPRFSGEVNYRIFGVVISFFLNVSCKTTK